MALCQPAARELAGQIFHTRSKRPGLSEKAIRDHARGKLVSLQLVVRCIIIPEDTLVLTESQQKGENLCVWLMIMNYAGSSEAWKPKKQQIAFVLDPYWESAVLQYLLQQFYQALHNLNHQQQRKKKSLGTTDQDSVQTACVVWKCPLLVKFQYLTTSGIPHHLLENPQ